MFFNRESEYGMGGFPRTHLEHIHRGLGEPATQQVKPFLRLVAMLELRHVSLALGCEELVEIEFVELARGRDLTDLIGHLIGHQHHTRQRLVRVPPVLSLPTFLGALLIGIRPVEDMLLDELTIDDGPERRARQEQVRARGDRQEIRITLLEALIDELRDGIHVVVLLAFVLFLEQFTGTVTPSTEMIFIEDDQIPAHRVHPLVARLDATGLVLAQKILERTETHDGTGLVRMFVIQPVAGHGLTGDELLRCPSLCSSASTPPSTRRTRHRPSLIYFRFDLQVTGLACVAQGAFEVVPCRSDFECCSAPRSIPSLSILMVSVTPSSWCTIDLSCAY